VLVAGNGIARGQFCAIGRHVNELVAPGDIACGIDAGRAGFEVIVHHDPALAIQRDATLFQPHAIAVGLAASSDQHLFGGDDPARSNAIAGEFHP